MNEKACSMMPTDSLAELQDDVECDTIDIFRDHPELVEKHAQLQYVALRLPLVENPLFYP